MTIRIVRSRHNISIHQALPMLWIDLELAHEPAQEPA